MVAVLNYQTAVPRRFVHRQAITEVYITDSITLGDDHFLVGAQWPRLHAFYRTCTGRYDTMLLVETMRQCGIYVAHIQYSVPLHYKFTMQRMEVEADVDLLTVGSSAAEVAIDVRVTGIARRQGFVSAFTVTVEFCVDGQVVGRGSADANVLSPAAYEHVRWRGAGARVIGRPTLSAPVAYDAVCVADRDAVVLGAHPAGPGSGKWLLRSNLAHPILFDHPLDHVPGALILEAARQSARLRLEQSCADVEHIALDFRRFLELDEPTTVTASIAEDNGSCVDIEFSQWGAIRASGTVRLAVAARSQFRAVVGAQRV